MADIKRIGVITSGGDCGGLNAVIKGVAREAWALGIESVVILMAMQAFITSLTWSRLLYLTQRG